MKNLLFKITAFIVVVAFAVSCNETLVPEENPTEIGLKSGNSALQSYIVVLNDAELDAELSNLKGYEKRKGAAQKAAAKVLKRAGIAGQIGHAYGTAIKGFSVKIPPGQLKKLENDPSVKYVEEDRIITLAPPLITNAVSTTSTQTVPWGISRVNGGGENVPTDPGAPKAWIVDTGIDLDHPDLNVNTTLSESFVYGEESVDDANGHGTHVAGTVAAINNDVGVVGVAPGAEVISCRVLGSDGTGYFSWTIAALDYIAITASPGDVVNMSLGPQSRYTDQAVDDAVVGAAAAGVKIAMSAGNSADDATYYSPARVNYSNVYTIAAMGEGDVWSSYSNFGSPVDFIEPGTYVYSTYRNGGYITMSGTSMASPHMAGILLLGDPIADGSVSVRKRGRVYTYPIGVISGGIDPDPINNPPVAEAGEPQSVNEGENVQLQGSGSDLDNDPLTYSWTAPDGINLSNASIPNPTFTAPAVSTQTVYTFSLVVNDGTEDSQPSTVDITVIDISGGGEIILSADAINKNVNRVTLTWSGASGSVVVIKRSDSDNGYVEFEVSNSGSYNDNLGKLDGITYTYEICETDNSLCSEPAIASF